MERKRAHLEMIQGVVNRLAQSSFLLKGWSVVLVSALFVLGAKDSTPAFVYVAYFPAIAFWFLDGYFLWQERLFRALYDHVRELEEDDVDFSMDVSAVTSGVNSWSQAILSKTLLIFHGVIIATILFVMLFLMGTNGGQEGGTTSFL